MGLNGPRFGCLTGSIDQYCRSYMEQNRRSFTPVAQLSKSTWILTDWLVSRENCAIFRDKNYSNPTRRQTVYIPDFMKRNNYIYRSCMPMITMIMMA